MTGRDVITAALRLIGAIAPGESIESAEAEDGLASLNRMISSWSTENLLINSKVREELTLTVSDGTYTMGPSGDMNTTRPVKIDAASIEDQSATPDSESPLEIIDMNRWALIPNKEVDGLPRYLYVEATMSTVTLNLWPRPDVANKIVIYSSKVLSAVTLAGTLSFAPGYEEALIYNLAIRLAPEYGKQTPAEVASIATESRATIKRVNHIPRMLTADPALVTVGAFNMLTGGN